MPRTPVHARHLARRRKLGRPGFGSLALTCDPAKACCGIAFHLGGPVLHPHLVELNGWEVEVVGGSDLIVARGPGMTDIPAIKSTALPVTLEALDLMAFTLNESYSVKSVDQPAAVWRCEEEALVVRLELHRTSAVGGPRQDDEGRMILISEKPLPTSLPKGVWWHESFRYYRLSQTSDDLFEAYRNAYLALESILSTLAPPDDGKRREPEGMWMRRALGVAAGKANLKGFAEDGEDAVDTIMRIHYEEIRGGLAHAKAARPTLLPQRVADRDTVKGHLSRLVQLYERVASVTLGLGGGRGFVFPAFLRGLAKTSMDGSTAFVAVDGDSFDPESPKGVGESATMTAIGDAYDGSDAYPTAEKVWRVDSEDMRYVPTVARVGLLSDDEDARLVALLDPALTVGWADAVELLVAERGTTAGTHRADYGA